MSIRRRKGFRAIAVFLAFALVQISIQLSVAAPPAPATAAVVPQATIARVITRGGNISINGNSSATGATALTGAVIEVPPGVVATLNLGSLGSIDIAPGSRIELYYSDDGNVTVKILEGCIVTRSNKGSRFQVDTAQQANVAQTDKDKPTILDVCFGPGGTSVGQGSAANAVANAALGGTTAGGEGISKAALIAVLAGGSAVAVGLIWAFHHGGENPSPGT